MDLGIDDLHGVLSSHAGPSAAEAARRAGCGVLASTEPSALTQAPALIDGALLTHGRDLNRGSVAAASVFRGQYRGFNSEKMMTTRDRPGKVPEALGEAIEAPIGCTPAFIKTLPSWNAAHAARRAY
jgi:hypothetical protein